MSFKKSISIFTLLLLIFALFSCADEDITYEKRIAVVGDSISAGWNPDYNRIDASYGWVEMITGEGGGSYPAPQANTVDTLWNPTLLSNFSKAGSKASEWTSTTWLNPVADFNPDIIIVYLGGNDVLGIFNEEGTIDETKLNEQMTALGTNLTTIITFLQNALPEAELFLVDYYDLFDGKSENLETEFGGEFSKYMPVSEVTISGNTSLSNIAAEAGIGFISVYDAFMHRCYGRDIGDEDAEDPAYVMDLDMTLDTPWQIDIHPNTNGHKAIYELVFEALLELNTPE